MFQTIVVAVIVGVTLFLVGRRLWRMAKGRGQCNCGCCNNCSYCPKKSFSSNMRKK